MTTVGEVFDALDRPGLPASGGSVGGGGPVGPHACARARVPNTDSDREWGEATFVFDRLRALVRRLPAARQAGAWQAVADGLARLHEEINQQFDDKREV